MIDGSPESLRRGVAVQRRAGSVLLDAATSLDGLARDEVSIAIDALGAQTRLLVAELSSAERAHHGIAAVIAEYADRLEWAQRRAESADQSRAAAATDLVDVEQRIRSLTDQVATGDVLALESRLADEQLRADRLRWRINEAVSEHRAAEAERDAAAEMAIARLDAVEVAHGGAPRLVGDAPIEVLLAHLVEEWRRRTAAILEATILDAIGRLDRVLMLASGILWEALLILAGIGLGMHLAAVIGSGPPGWLLLSAVGTLLSAVVVASLLAEMRAPTPVVRALPPRHGTTRDAVARPAEALREAAEVDALGGDARTVVKITEVTGADGIVRWRVALPSTQDWSLRVDDAGAVNDLDANLALVLTPDLPTQYERAVLEAMRHAGIGPADPVLLVGFSQGGILAAHLAARRDDFAWAAVIAAGAPLGAAPIAETIEVVTVEHLGDPVPRLEIDLARGGQAPDREGWTTIRAASAESPRGLSGIHSAEQYDRTLQRHADRLARRHPDLEAFFAEPAASRSRYYTWQE